MSIRSVASTLGLAWLAFSAVGCGSDSRTEGQGSDERSSQEAPPSEGEELLARLRSGGLVVMFRHAATDRSDDDDPEVDLDDCTTQRNLTAEGRADARRIGASFRDLRIPVGPVWASPYCRARDTAELAFGGSRVVHGLERLYPVRDEAADRRMNRMIREHGPDPGEPNLVISAHGVYPSLLKPAVTLDEGEAAVYEVGATDVRLLDRIAPNDWGDLGAGGASQGADRELSDVSRRVQRSVVSVESREGEQAGTGFRVAVDGIVVTSAAVVGNADEVTVALADGTRRPARVLGRAPDVDVAVLELDDTGLPPLHSRAGLAEARIGDAVLAVGSDAVTSATIDTLRARVRLDRTSELDALAIDVAIEPSQSGGPLVNRRGDVLGLSTAIATPRPGSTATGTGFAVPVDLARSATLAIAHRRG